VNRICRAGVALLFACVLTQGAEYYVDVESCGGKADDAGPGSLGKPWRTLNRVVSDQQPSPGPGDTVWIRGGVYKESMRLLKGGTADRVLSLRAFRDEKPIVDGEGKRRNGIVFAAEGTADHVLLEGVTLRNFAPRGVAVSVTNRTGVTIRKVNVSGVRIGVWLTRCTDCRLLESDVHHCGEGNVYLDQGCRDLVVADNHIHHNLKKHSLSIYAPGNAVRARGEIASVVPHGPGLVRATFVDVDLRKSRASTLKGQNEAGTLANPGLALPFAKAKLTPDELSMPGGTVRLPDGRDWFVLRANPDWNGKPYSPDGKSVLIEVGKASAQDLAATKHMYLVNTYSSDVASQDIRILRNEIDHSAVQGIWMQRTEGVLIQGNRTHHNGATGIQIESLSRRVWLDGNVSYANCQTYGHETGIWLDETVEAVVQNNIVYENQKGMGVTQGEWTIMRRNVIRDNRGQHITKDVEGRRRNAGGFWYSGGRHYHLGAPPGSRNNAFVHNTVVRNGWETSTWGGIQHGIPGYPTAEGNRFLNNLVQGNLGTHPIYVGRTPAFLDGNLYHGKQPFGALWVGPDGKATYDFADAKSRAAYQRATGQDTHSQFIESPTDGAGRPAAGSPAIDAGQPLTRTTTAAAGTATSVADTSCFTAGLKTRTGEVVMPGDEIMIGKTMARVVDIDRAKTILTVDKKLSWQKGDGVSYRYQGSAPDVGAFEVR